MARIRSIKPEFFRHHRLYKAEVEEGLPLRVAFAGLWTVADREGRFKWEVEELKLDCLPFDDIDFERVLHALTTRGFIVPYTSDGRRYAVIPSFTRHQVINNRERPSELPEPTQDIEQEDLFTPAPRVPHASATRHDLAQAEGKGREQGTGKGREEDSLVVADATPPEDPLDIPLKFDRTEIGDAVRAWNAFAETHGLAPVQKMTQARKAKVRARLKDCGGLDGWNAALEKAGSIPGLLGGHGGNGHEGWRASFDFLLSEQKFTRLMEGAYDHWGKSSSSGYAEILRELTNE